MHLTQVRASRYLLGICTTPYTQTHRFTSYLQVLGVLLQLQLAQVVLRLVLLGVPQLLDGAPSLRDQHVQDRVEAVLLWVWVCVRGVTW